MAKRHQDALAIWAGACNPSGICHSIIAAQKEIFDTPDGGTQRVRDDAAVRLMVAQLAYLCGVWDGVSEIPTKQDPAPTLGECSRLVTVCEQEVINA